MLNFTRALRPIVDGSRSSRAASTCNPIVTWSVVVGVAEAETPEKPDAAADGEALIRADGETAIVAAGEAVAVAAPHPATRSATAMAAQRRVRVVTLEGRLIDSPINGRLRSKARARHQ
jgi:hypothetical protein